MPDQNGNPTLEELQSMHCQRKSMNDSISWADCLRNGKLADCTERKKWLPQFGSELERDWLCRIGLTNYDPELPSIVSRVTQLVWKRDPRREMGHRKPEMEGVEVEAEKGNDDSAEERIDGEALEAFARNCTRQGKALGNLARAAAKEALWCRFSVALIDRRPLSADAPKALTKADDQAQGLDKPYVTLFNAANVLDWRANQDGNLEYIKLQSTCYTKNKERIQEIREITASAITVWEIYTDDVGYKGSAGARPSQVRLGKKVDLTGTPLGKLGIVPVVICRDPDADGDPIFCSGRLVDAAIAERRALQALSSYLFSCELVAHPKIKAWLRPTLVDGVMVAPTLPWQKTSFICLDPGTPDKLKEDAAYMEISGAGLTHLFTQYQEAKSRIYAKAGVSGRAARSVSQEATAGAAQSGRQAEIEFEIDESHTLASIATMAETFESQVLQLVALDMGLVDSVEDAKEFVEVAYHKEEFGVSSADRAVARCTTISNRNLLGPTATAEIKKRTVPSVLPGLPDPVLQKIIDEIDEGEAEVKPNPELLGGAAISRFVKPPVPGAQTASRAASRGA